MNYFLVPLTSQTVGTQTVSAPKYLATDMAGLAFSCVPFGAEGFGIVALANANPTLAAESDVYAFPALTTTLADSDVSTLAAFLTNINCPSDQLTAGMTFAAALQVIATIFLTAQALFGLTGNAIFTNGATLDSQISDTGVASVAPTNSINVPGPGNRQAGGGQTISVSGPGLDKLAGGVAVNDDGQQQQQTQAGPFDLSSIQAPDTVGDTLTALASQFTATVNLGAF